MPQGYGPPTDPMAPAYGFPPGSNAAMPPGYGPPQGPGAPQPPGAAMPPGYGAPSGAMPPGYGGPPGGPPAGMGQPGMPGQQAAGLAPPPKPNRTMLYAGIGCLVFVLLAVLGVVASLYWLKAQSKAAVDELQRMQASASAMAGGVAPPTGPGGEPTGECLVAYRCCLAIAAKSPAGAAATQACEVFKTPSYPASVCSTALTGYRKVAEQTGVKCE